MSEFERTSAGLQIVILGCERRTLPKSTTLVDEPGQGLLGLYKPSSLRKRSKTVQRRLCGKQRTKARCQRRSVRSVADRTTALASPSRPGAPATQPHPPTVEVRIRSGAPVFAVSARRPSAAGMPVGARRPLAQPLCVSARGLDHDRRGGSHIPFSEINGLKGSRRRRWGALFDQYPQPGCRPLSAP